MASQIFHAFLSGLPGDANFWAFRRAIIPCLSTHEISGSKGREVMELVIGPGAIKFGQNSSFGTLLL